MKRTTSLAAFCAAVLATASCSLTGEDDTPLAGGLTISVSTSVIQANGEDAAQIYVKEGDQTVTDGVTIYDAKTNKPLDLPDMTFTTTTAGEYEFWAAYGTEHTDAIKVTAVDFAIPALPEDPSPTSTSFSKKLFITQFTGTECGWCPYMINIIRSVASDPDYSDKFVLAAAHTLNNTDPAYFSGPINQAMGITGYPTVVFDMMTRFNYYNNEAGFRSAFDATYGREKAQAGISASSYYDESTVVVRVSVKAAESGEYRVGAWLLEDGIVARQTNNGATGDFNTHDNCVRLADSRVSSSNYTGHSLEEIKKGETAEYVFSMQLDSDWKKENLHLALFVSSKQGKGFAVTNAVSCPIDGSVQYDYE